MCVKVPDWAGASDLHVDIRRSRLSIAVLPRNSPQHPGIGGTSPSPAPATKGKGESGVVAPASTSPNEKVSVLAGVLSRPVQVDECLWTTERRGSVVLYLQKELPAEGDPGFEWWANVMEGDPEINTSECDAGSIASEYPEHVRRRGAKSLWDDQRKSPEEKLNEVRRFLLKLHVDARCIRSWSDGTGEWGDSKPNLQGSVQRYGCAFSAEGFRRVLGWNVMKSFSLQKSRMSLHRCFANKTATNLFVF